jgi:alanine racemase
MWRGGKNAAVKSWVEVSQARLRANVAVLRAAAGVGAELLAVIKADGYGHGAELVAPLLIDAGVTWLGVGDIDEGARVRRALGAREARILVMCGPEPDDAGAIVEHRLTPVVWTPAQIAALKPAAERAGTRVAVHLEIDSGMARQGAAPGPELAAFLAALQHSKRLDLEGVFSHLSSSEVRNSRQTAAQLQTFERALQQLRSSSAELPSLRWIHLANSSALDEGSTTAQLRQIARDLGATVLVRPGLALYGHCLPLQDEAGDALEDPGELCASLQPVLTWKARILATREIAPGQTVGYGATFIAEHPMRLALLPVGYADGFRREASTSIGNGWVTIAGKRAPVVGRVSMNLTVVDVTRIPEAQEGVEATLLGPGVSAADHALWCGTIPYEILCGLRAPRRLA